MNILKLRSKQSGYILLLLMLVIGSLGLYLSYQFYFEKMNTQSWQVAKTATEFSYWFDIEQNYEQDYASTLQGATTQITGENYNAIQLTDLMLTKHYLPYGMARSPTFPNSPSDQVSEFLCSPLPGITAQDTQDRVLTLSGDGDPQTCPINPERVTVQHCDLLDQDKVYYSCANNAAISQAQYYINANYISIGNYTNFNTGLGLILRTPGFASGLIDLGLVGDSTGNPSTRALLPNGSSAQSLISTLPGSAFNVYTTQNPQVNGIGMGSYLNSGIDPKLQENNRYSKIIDMGLVQSVDLSKASDATPCYGWDASGNKIGVQNSYTGSDPGIGTRFPPTCIRIDTTQYSTCKSIDVLYTMYRNAMGGPSAFYSYTDAYVQKNGNISNVFLGQKLQIIPASGIVTNPVGGQYTSNGGSSDSNNQQYTWLIYMVRCTRDYA